MTVTLSSGKEYAVPSSLGAIDDDDYGVLGEELLFYMKMLGVFVDQYVEHVGLMGDICSRGLGCWLSATNARVVTMNPFAGIG